MDGGTKLLAKTSRSQTDSISKSDKFYRVPNRADFLIVYSTTPGNMFGIVMNILLVGSCYKLFNWNLELYENIFCKDTTRGEILQKDHGSYNH